MMHRSWSLLASALLLAAAPAPTPADRDGEVRAISLVPASGRAELVIQIQGAVQVTDRTLTDPNRIVLDISLLRSLIEFEPRPLSAGIGAAWSGLRSDTVA